MLNSEVIFLEFVTGMSDFGGKLEIVSKKKKITVGRGGQHNNFSFGLTYNIT